MSYIGAKPAEQILSSADIQDGSIATADLANSSVTQAKLASGVAGSGPACAAYASSSQSVSNNTWTKVTLGTEIFDTNSNFASSRFTPTVAGYYQINVSLCLYATGSFPIEQVGAIYVNGSSHHYICDISPNASLTSNNFSLVNGSTIIYLNGSTDYVELYGYYYGVGASASFEYSTTSRTSRFSAALIRSA